MSQKCSKCGIETDYKNDLHCREIFQAETRKLLLCGKIKEAEHFISKASFNEEWKLIMRQRLFVEPEVRQKLKTIWQQQDFVLVQAQNQFIELANKYKVDINKVVNWSGPTLLAIILVKLEEKNNLSESDLKWIEENRLFELLANYYWQLYDNSPINDAWSLSKASKFLRKANMNEKAIEITNGFSERNTIDLKADSAVYVSRGAAFRDLSNLDEAKKCANEAIGLSPQSFHPYNLLGGIYYDEGDIENGTRYFERAIELGSSPKIQVEKIKSATEEERKRIINYLLDKDPKKYAWVKQFQL